jgi:hypothetical protein
MCPVINWGLVVLIIWLIRKYIVKPRIGTVKFGAARKTRLIKLNRLILALNVIALILGILFAFKSGYRLNYLPVIILSLILLIGFSIAAYYLNINRLVIYGLLAGISPAVGEWLFRRQLATHHGFPITFGITAGILILTGLIIFIRFLITFPILHTDNSTQKG